MGVSHEHSIFKRSHPRLVERLEVTDSFTHETLDQLLDQYRGSQIESKGMFTLDPQRARELLGRFRLKHPDEYILHLLSFLIGAGSTSVNVDLSDSFVTTLIGAGAVVDEDIIRSPFAAFARSGTEPHLAELGIGLNAFLSATDRRVELGSANLVSTFQGCEVKILDSTESKAGIRILCRRSDKPRSRQEEAFIRRSFRWSPISIFVGEEDITVPVGDGPSVFELHLHNEKYPLRFTDEAALRIEKPVWAGFSALLRIGPPNGRLLILTMGRCFEKPTPWTFWQASLPVDIVINSDRLKTDLSHQAIVEDQKYHNLLASLKSQLLKVLEELLVQESPCLESEAIGNLFVEQLFQSGRADLALDLQTRLCKRFARIPDTLARGLAVFRLGLIQQSLQMPDGVSNLRYGASLLGSLEDEKSFATFWGKIRARMVFAPNEADLPPLVALVAQAGGEDVHEPCYRWLSMREADQESRLEARVKLIKALLQKGAGTAAGEEIDAALAEIGPEATVAGSGFVVKILELRAELSLKNGHLEESVQHLQELLNLLVERFGRRSTRLGLTLKRLALLAEERGGKKKSRQWRRWIRSLRLRE